MSITKTLCLCLLLTSCATVPKSPKVVIVPDVRYVPIPEELTKHCPIAIPADKTALEAWKVAAERGLSLKDCNISLDKIRGIQGSPVPKTN
jgi:hypothetical protein